MEKEIRLLASNLELREVGEEKEIHMQGYALNFDTISEDLGFRETIRKGALDDTNMDNVVLNFNHDMSKPLARNKKSTGKGSLTLTLDEKGLFFDAIPTDTSYSRDLLENMKEGLVGKCSFAFSLDYNDKDSQSWDWDDGTRGYDFRTINKINRLYDVSIVTNPAYESTSCTSYSRAKDKMNEELKKDKEEREIELLKIELELI
ncbi:HK97 family phage prohead protease [Clostridium tertium]|uniref:HK97 family phage prohead protease n=1 Tax=Clostridium tertium TaxID=1559 RepID=UPI00232BF5C1|nr:HK97 family phage prohead protease [Clostridium tertium]MDB1931679.1 HK97 family phage prohead protease [Clostridium tertium]MDB1938275.1 HK97 family phage prohead protease [Clostridium tertium]